MYSVENNQIKYNRKNRKYQSIVDLWFLLCEEACVNYTLNVSICECVLQMLILNHNINPRL